MPRCDLYYSYNIPIKNHRAKIKWFHLSNVLTYSGTSQFNIPIKRKVELFWLGVLTRNNIINCDFVSAESKFSLELMALKDKEMIVSVNGSDQELNLLSEKSIKNKFENMAVVVGTYHHKNLQDSFKVFKFLQKKNTNLSLKIVGDVAAVPASIKKDPNVTLCGVLSHSQIIEILSKARFYINTSKIENSWNAASEGIFLSKESFISKIPPHIELLKNNNFEDLNDVNTAIPIIHVHRNRLKTINLKTWDEVIRSMLESLANLGMLTFEKSIA